MKPQSKIYSRYFTYIKPVMKMQIMKTYGSTIFTLLVMAVFIFFAIKPTLETILVLQKKLVDSNQVRQKVNQKADNLILGKQNLDKMDPSIRSAISQAIPDNVSLKQVFQTLELTAKANEASISALQVQPLVLETKENNQLGTLAEVSFTFNVEGEYRNLILLLQNLKSSARLVSIDSLSISKSSEGGGLIMSISGKTYYIK